MAYEIYKKYLNKKKYFDLWEKEKIDKIPLNLLDDIYNKYLVKCDVFNRDNYICRNKECSSEKDLTLHHIKWQKNGGKDKVNNCITLCDKCHKKFHKGQINLIFEKDKNLPKNLSGKTFNLHKEEKINWKLIIKENKQLRKALKHEIKHINWDVISLLIRWLEMK